LELRYHNAKILLHRPFVAASTLHKSSELSRNVEACLSAAQSTIHLLYESYLHRYYFRTWRYNCTYTVYATTIILYLILLDYNATPASDLISDVRKSLDILLSMEEAPVVRRCADLVRELLEVALEHIRRRQARSNTSLNSLEHQQQHAEGSKSQPSLQNTVASNNPHDLFRSEQGSSRMQSALDFLQPSFGFNYNGGTSTSMNEMWASMMDPGTLESFAIGGEAGDLSFESPWTLEELNALPPNRDMTWYFEQ